MGWGSISETNPGVPPLAGVTAGEHRWVLGEWKVVWGEVSKVTTSKRSMRKGMRTRDSTGS